MSQVLWISLMVLLLSANSLTAKELTNDEIRDLKLPTIHATDDDAEALRQAIERIDIIENKAVDLP